VGVVSEYIVANGHTKKDFGVLFEIKKPCNWNELRTILNNYHY